MRYVAPWHVKTLAWLKAYWWVPLVVLVFLVGLAIFIVTRGKAGVELLRVDRRLIASKEKADKEIEDLETETEAQIVEVERKHAARIEHFEDNQRVEYERVRKRGPDHVAAWLTAFDRSF